MRKTIIWLLLILLISVKGDLPVYAANYTYDNLNRLTSVTYDNGKKLTYSYDAVGNILSINNETSQDSLQVTPDTVIESNNFEQTFTIALNSGNFTDNITTSCITLGGDFSGLTIGAVSKTLTDTITVAINGILYKDTGTGNITVSAAGTDTSNSVTANITVKSSLILNGDVNQDEIVDVSDAILILQHIVGLTQLDTNQLQAANVSDDSDVDVGDAILIMQKIVGTISKFPIQS